MKRLKRSLLVLLCLVVALSGAGCGGGALDEDFEDDGEFYTAKVVMAFNAATIPADLDMVLEKVNEITRREINCEIDLVPYIMSEYMNKSNLMVSSGETFDLLHSNASNYFLNIEMQGYFPLNRLLPKYAPKTWNYYAQSLWDQLKFTDGRIYGVINNQILPRTGSFWARDNDLFQAFMQKKGYHESSFADMTLSQRFDVMENYALYLKEEGKGKGKGGIGRTFGLDIANFLDSFVGFDMLCQGVGVPGVVRATDDLSDGRLEVIDQFRSPEFLEYLARLEKWNELEIIPEDPTDIGGGGAAMLDFQIGSTWKPDDKVKYKSFGQDKEMVNYAFSKSYYYQSALLGSMWSVSATSKNPARAVKLIELFHTNAEINNLFKIGIEGEHYELINDGKQAKNISSRYYNDDTRWAIGNEFLTLPLDTQSPDVWERTEKINEEAEIPAIIGFVFDRQPVLTEIQLCQSVYTTYAKRLEDGRERHTFNTGIYEEFLQKMTDAGADKVIREKQRQLDLYLAGLQK